ncbi:glycosyltransferase family 25 protein [uncultured Photobacterium sp.]|uniref:glycosyltransferase family 25 protein n=1 Tax=uncultured Photobacterium sp. TaxID=173973 RepID=UPI0026152AC9|nr:glycosyltransferase family 25 protein [uncultured Photobacterium sp.]
MKAFVISLVDSLERRKKVMDILGQHHIHFNLINGIDGRKENHPFLKRYNEKEFIFHYGRKAAPGELGCYASHILAWQKCVELGEPILVFEDDLVLKPGVKEAIKACEKLISDYGFIRMESTRKKPQYPVKHVGKFTLFNFMKIPQCTTCYAISPQVAKAFLKHSQTIRLPVDVFIRNIWIHKQPIYGLQPFLISASNDESLIGKRAKLKHKPLSIQLICLLFKARRILFNGYYQLKWRLTRRTFVSLLILNSQCFMLQQLTIQELEFLLII